MIAGDHPTIRLGVYAKVLTEGVPGVSPVWHMPLVSLAWLW
jgi:hypothetical protein